MNKILTAAAFFVSAALLILSPRIYAGTNDTLAVYANGPSLDQIINSDTTASGAQVHSAYKLITLDTTYLVMSPIVDKSEITIVGQLGSDGRPPCIQPGVLSDGSKPAELYLIPSTGAKLTLKNLYIYGLAIDNSYNGGPIILQTADSTRITMDHVVTNETHCDIIDYSGNYGDYFITNCDFRNGVWPNNWFSTMIINTVYPASPPADSIVMNNNTLFCLNSNAMYVGVNGPTNYVEFNHNTFLYNFQFTFQVSYTVMDFRVENNIFYCVYAGGVRYNQYHFFYYQKGWAPVSAIELDTMRFAPNWDPAYAQNPWLIESKRVAVIKNNCFFEPKALTDFWTTWNDTAHAKYDSLITCEWMNPETQNMFADKTHWPNFVESNNIVGTDPGFGPSIAGVLDGSGPNTGVGLLKYITEVRTGVETTDEWGYAKEQVSGDNWIPTWPLPEAKDMIYTNATVKNSSNDGLPLGDPSWFGPVTPASVITLWQKSAATSNLPAWFNTTSQMRCFAYNKAGNNEHLYAVNASKAGSVVTILNAATGDSVGALDTTGVSGGIFPLDDIKASSDGILFGANLTVNAQTAPFKVYRWDSETGKAAAVISYSENAYRLGDHITVTGAAADNSLTIWAPVSGQNNIVKFTTTDHGATFTAQVLQLTDTQTTGVMPKVYPAGNNILVSSDLVGVREYDASGKFLGALTSAPITAGSIAYYTGSNANYVLVYDYNAELVNIYDVTNGLDKAALVLSTPALGTAANLNGTGDIALKTNTDGTLTVFLLGTNNGFGAYKLNTIITDVEKDNISSHPDSYSLSQNYPNPFNPSTNIRFSLAKSGNVSLKIYNVMGQLVKSIISNEYKSRGTYEYNINMDSFASGIYFYILNAGNQRITRKMVLLK